MAKINSLSAKGKCMKGIYPFVHGVPFILAFAYWNHTTFITYLPNFSTKLLPPPLPSSAARPAPVFTLSLSLLRAQILLSDIN